MTYFPMIMGLITVFNAAGASYMEEHVSASIYMLTFAVWYYIDTQQKKDKS